MACSVTSRDAASDLVCGVIGRREGRDVNDTTRFNEDLGVNAARRRDYFDGVQEELGRSDCRMKTTTPDDFAKSSNATVGSVVTIVWNDVKAQTTPSGDAEDFIELRAATPAIASILPDAALDKTQITAFLDGYVRGVEDLARAIRRQLASGTSDSKQNADDATAGNQ